MTEPRTDRDAAQKSMGQSAEPVRYPEDHLLGIVDTPEKVTSVVVALADAGFRTSEISIASGPAAADALEASTGRTGLANLAIRIAERIGIANDEMAMKDRYEQALRTGGFVVSILAPTDDRKDVAAQILRGQGGHFINFLGHRTIEAMHP
jgi:hypothetical protein